MPTAVEDKDAIREVLAEYCFRLDEGRFDGMAELFTEDGTWDTAFGKATGRAAIAELARRLRERGAQPRPRARPGALQLDGGAEQPAGSKSRFGWRLYRRDGQRRRAVAIPLPQDRPLHRPVTR